MYILGIWGGGGSAVWMLWKADGGIFINSLKPEWAKNGRLSRDEGIKQQFPIPPHS